MRAVYNDGRSQWSALGNACSGRLVPASFRGLCFATSTPASGRDIQGGVGLVARGLPLLCCLLTPWAVVVLLRRKPGGLAHAATLTNLAAAHRATWRCDEAEPISTKMRQPMGAKLGAMLAG